MGSIRRGAFEELARQAFDPVVSGYGFSLTPQPPADHPQRWRAMAVYETAPAEFIKHFPSWATEWDLDDVGCVDLWIEADLTTNHVDVHLEGERIRELAKDISANVTTNDMPARTRLEDALHDEAALCARVLASRADA